jgi:hypothetical protein
LQSTRQLKARRSAPPYCATPYYAQFVERGEKPDDLIFALVAKDMQTPGTVFAATPGQENSLPSENLF